jgi:hypothetical protein
MFSLVKIRLLSGDMQPPKRTAERNPPDINIGNDKAADGIRSAALSRPHVSAHGAFHHRAGRRKV